MNIGDYVICVDNSHMGNSLEIGGTYVIISVRHFRISGDIAVSVKAIENYKLKPIYQPPETLSFNSKRFKLLTPLNRKKKLEKLKNVCVHTTPTNIL